MPVLTDSIHIKKDFANLCCEKDAKEVLISLPAFHPHPSPPPRGKPPTNRRAGSCCAHSGTYCRDITGGEMDSNGFYKVIISNILYLSDSKGCASWFLKMFSQYCK